jgi:hypothetical protein
VIHLCLAFDAQMALGAYAACASAMDVTPPPMTIHFITDHPADLIERCVMLLRDQGA